MAAATGKIITIGRSYGAGGRSIGRQVAEDLKIPYYDSELLAETAKSSGLDEKYLASVDEKEINDAALYMSVGYMSPTYSSVRQIAAKRIVSLISELCLSSAISCEHASTRAVSSDILMSVISLQNLSDPLSPLFLGRLSIDLAAALLFPADFLRDHVEHLPFAVEFT